MKYDGVERKKQRTKGVCFHNTRVFEESYMTRVCSTLRLARGEDDEVPHPHKRVCVVYWYSIQSLEPLQPRGIKI